MKYLKNVLGIIAGVVTMITATANIIVYGNSEINLSVLVCAALLVIGWEVTKDNGREVLAEVLKDPVKIEELGEEDFEILDAEEVLEK